MCGIVYYKEIKENKPVYKAVIERFNAQRGRGLNGFGFFIPNENRLVHNTNETRIKRLLKKTSASEILFHHRFPTSTPNVRNSCHPFSTKDRFKRNYVLVHNGWLTNDDVLQKEHYKQGIEYVSMQSDGQFNDSEALLYDVALFLDGKQTEMKAQGDIAFIVVAMKGNKAEKLYFGCNNTNLRIDYQKGDHLTLASEGEGGLVPQNIMHEYDYKTDTIKTSECIFSREVFSIYPTSKAYEWYDSNEYSEASFALSTGALRTYNALETKHSGNQMAMYADLLEQENECFVILDDIDACKRRGEEAPYDKAERAYVESELDDLDEVADYLARAYSDGKAKKLGFIQ